ncbi:MAG TPA: bifunctional glutamate N-acetyltransferase/amino-acid acetyltransferase ArgJ [Lachnospiraceae bacterium]|nr:bifunctional glutamate N-acetyltransferase/amino-acid acetyltransferase ArgJ [Lachnospiraceae bacterium]
MRNVVGGVCAAKGFQAAGVEAGIKYQNRKDMALVYSEMPCTCAGTFTTNVVKAAPVIWDKKVVEESAYAQAVVINSGIANACTGKPGMECCERTAKKVSEELHIPVDSVLIGSTGVIGMQIPVEKIEAGVEKLASQKEHSIKGAQLAAEAIMTTDTLDKQVAVSFEIQGKTVTMGGMSKGSGMIHPNMCTMLAFVTCDISISKKLLQKAVKESIQDTYNMISVDGDTSTNDTFICMANKMAGNSEITEENEDYQTFFEALMFVNTTLAKKMAGDGEGATALFETKVIGAKTKEDARILSKSVICSSLSKAAIFGHDANFGRFLCALGYSGVGFDPEKVELFFQSKSGCLKVYGDGLATDFSEEEAKKILSDPEVTVLVDMHVGDASATAWGCDLSFDYVKINADYRS